MKWRCKQVIQTNWTNVARLHSAFEAERWKTPKRQMSTAGKVRKCLTMCAWVWQATPCCVHVKKLCRFDHGGEGAWRGLIETRQARRTLPGGQREKNKTEERSRHRNLACTTSRNVLWTRAELFFMTVKIVKKMYKTYFVCLFPGWHWIDLWIELNGIEQNFDLAGFITDQVQIDLGTLTFSLYLG